MEKMKGKLIKTGNDYILRDLSGEVLGITIGEINGKLSLKNCQAIERGYDLDELTENFYERTGYHDFDSHSYKLGFQKALEILGDRRFTLEQMIAAYNIERSGTLFDQFINSFGGQQNEWEVEIEMDICGDKVYAVPEPKLDAEGCIILKRVV